MNNTNMAIEHQHPISQFIFDNIPHDIISVMDVDAVWTYYNTPGKPQAFIEYKNSREKIRPSQWFNFRRWEKEGMMCLVLRLTHDNLMQVERMSDAYCNNYVLGIFNEEEIKTIAMDYELLKKLYISKNKNGNTL